MKKILASILSVFCVGACVCTAAVANNVNALAATNLPVDKNAMTELDAPPECRLTLEEAKIKNIAAGNWGYYNVEGDDVWYFKDDGAESAKGNPEIRFITDGTQTKTKPYTYAPIEVESFSFEYRIANEGEASVVDLQNTNYIVQILASDGAYPIVLPFIQDDGEWHTITVNQTTPITSDTENRAQYRDVDHLFSGFLFKMGGLNGEFMIRNVNLVVVGEENEDEPSTPSSPSTPSTPSTPSAPSNSVSSEASDDLVSEPSVSNGCGGVIGGSVAASVLAAAGVALLLRKRKEN